jgi:hypothetical protein
VWHIWDTADRLRGVVGNLRERAQFEESGLDWKIILKQALKKNNERL